MPFYMKRLCHNFHYNYHPQSSWLEPLPYYHQLVAARHQLPNIHKWQSKTNVVITNPTLLAMESCNSMNELKQVHAHMARNGIIAHAFPASRVLAFCAISDAGDIHYARRLFAHLDSPNTYTWNTMIRGCSRARIPFAGFEFFVRMVRLGVETNSLSFVYAFKACEQVMRFGVGESIFCVVVKAGFDCDLFVRNGFIRFCVERGRLVDARKVFDESPVRDVVSWTTVIDGYVKWGLWDEALVVFELMGLSDVEPNDVTMVAVFSACGGKGDAHVAKRVFGFIATRNANCGLNSLNAALDMFAKCSCMVEAREVFDHMKTRDVFSWTSMVNGYAKCNELDHARKLFDEMPERNAISWNAMIAGYSQNNRPSEALNLFDDMKKYGFVPTEHTLVCVLSSCGQLGCLDFGQSIHCRYIEPKQGQPSTILSNALTDMYAKCGRIDTAETLFDKMKTNRNLVSWNTMIAGYATHGYAKQALALFEEMKRTDLKPNDVTFVAVLSACSHGGLVKEGKEFFKSMARGFGVVPKREHYACVIDLLGRVGLIEEAYNMIRTMPIEAGESAWGSLLSACRIHGNVEMAKLSARKLLDLDPNDSGVYISLANALASEKRWSEVRTVRRLMREKGVKKCPGRSSVEIEGEFHEFLVGDETHPQIKEIYRVLNDVYAISNLEVNEQNMSPIFELDYGYGVDCFLK